MPVQTVSIDKIVIPDVRSNAVYTPEKYSELTASIANSGIQFLPVIRPLPDGRFEVVDGRHRIQVWGELGHKDIEADVQNLNDEQAFIKHVTANHHRGENDPVGLGKIVMKMREAGKKLDDIGKLIGYSASQTAQYETLAYLPDVYQQAVSSGKLKMVHIKEATRFDNPMEVDAALGYALQLKWTGETLHHYVENRIAELEMSRAKQQGLPPGAIIPPPPSPQLSQYRTCLICGAMGEAHEMSYPVLGTECKQTLTYLLEIDPNPWNAIQTMVTQLQGLEDAIAQRDAKIKELSDRLIDLSMRFTPPAAPAQQPYYPPHPPMPEVVQKPDTRWLGQPQSQ